MPFLSCDTCLRQVVSSQFRGAFSCSHAHQRRPLIGGSRLRIGDVQGIAELSSAERVDFEILVESEAGSASYSYSAEPTNDLSAGGFTALDPELTGGATGEGRSVSVDLNVDGASTVSGSSQSVVEEETSEIEVLEEIPEEQEDWEDTPGDDLPVDVNPAGCSPTLVTNYGPRWVNVGETVIGTSSVTGKYTYTTGADTTLGVGYSVSGAIGSFSTSGTSTKSSTSSISFPTQPANSKTKYFDTQFHMRSTGTIAAVSLGTK